MHECCHCHVAQVPFCLVFTKMDKRKKRCPSPAENIAAFQVRMSTCCLLCYMAGQACSMCACHWAGRRNIVQHDTGIVKGVHVLHGRMT